MEAPRLVLGGDLLASWARSHLRTLGVKGRTAGEERPDARTGDLLRMGGCESGSRRGGARAAGAGRHRAKLVYLHESALQVTRCWRAGVTLPVSDCRRPRREAAAGSQLRRRAGTGGLNAALIEADARSPDRQLTRRLRDDPAMPRCGPPGVGHREQCRREIGNVHRSPAEQLARGRPHPETLRSDKTVHGADTKQGSDWSAGPRSKRPTRRRHAMKQVRDRIVAGAKTTKMPRGRGRELVVLVSTPRDHHVRRLAAAANTGERMTCLAVGAGRNVKTTRWRGRATDDLADRCSCRTTLHAATSRRRNDRHPLKGVSTQGSALEKATHPQAQAPTPRQGLAGAPACAHG